MVEPKSRRDLRNLARVFRRSIERKRADLSAVAPQRGTVAVCDAEFRMKLEAWNADAFHPGG